MNILTRVCCIGLAFSAAACSDNPTGTSETDIQAAQASWSAHHLTRYAYHYKTTGFFNAFDGQEMRLVVIGDTVRSAQFVATNDSVPIAPGALPTIDALFAQAFAARQDGSLVSVTFDSTFAFPVRIQLSGPPDASGVISASNIELLP